MNPLFNELNPQNNMIRQFQEFKRTFNGNPKDVVMRMLSNGQISQAQLNQAQAMANQLKDILR